MALSDEKKELARLKEAVPESRVKAFSKLDLEKYVAVNPIEVSQFGEIEWDVEYAADGVGAFGFVKVPVAVYFEYGDLENDFVHDDLQVVRIDINGKRVMDDTIQKAEISFDPLATVDTAAIEGHAKKKYREL